jgi:CDGSH-type Zn-finger protein
MSEVTIRMRPNGPLVVEGPVKILDQNGNQFTTNPDKPLIALCRCGESSNRPFCDGTHKTAGFTCERLAPTPPAAG